jgi:hypothetical protein
VRILTLEWFLSEQLACQTKSHFMLMVSCDLSQTLAVLKLWNSESFIIQLHLIQMSDNLDQNMKNEECCLQLKYMAFRKADESLACSDKT